MNKIYIPGDFIEYNGEIYRVINSGSNGLYYISELMSRYMSESELSPIPLTLEILKKNGWIETKHKVDEDNFEWYVYENPEVKEIVFQYYPQSNIDMFSTFYYGDSEMIQINYVHELQHLLFGFGIDYKIIC